MRKLLRKIVIESDQFKTIVKAIRKFKCFHKVDKLGELIYGPGRGHKRDIYYEPSTNTLIISICGLKTLLKTYCNYDLDIQDWPEWSHARAVKGSIATVEKTEVECSGLQGYYTFRKILRKFYTDEETLDIMAHFQYEGNADKNTVKFMYKATPSDNKVHCYRNTYYYDINSAYAYYVSLAFPKAAKTINALFKKRKKNPNIKKWFLYFVGELKNRGEIPAKFRMWVVQQVSTRMHDLMSQMGGKLLYANTDGFVVQNPTIPADFKASRELGDFKEELRADDFYVLANASNSTYVVSQYLDRVSGKLETKGLSFPIKFKDQVDLSKGLTVVYNRHYNKELNLFEHTDVHQERRQIVYEEI